MANVCSLIVIELDFIQMAYSGEQKAFDLNANRPLPNRLLPERWELLQPTEIKLNNRERMNTPSAENTSIALPTVPKHCEDNQNYELSTYDNVPSFQNATLPYIDEDLHNYTNSLTPPSNISTKQFYVNIPPIIHSSSIDCSYFYSKTLLTAHSNVESPSSKQIATDILYFLIEASPHTSANRIQFCVLENMLNKHYKQFIIFHIDELLLAISLRNYKTFELIIRSCIAHIGFY